jgi:hypothetical protein
MPSSSVPTPGDQDGGAVCGVRIADGHGGLAVADGFDGQQVQPLVFRTVLGVLELAEQHECPVVPRVVVVSVGVDDLTAVGAQCQLVGVVPVGSWQPVQATEPVRVGGQMNLPVVGGQAIPPSLHRGRVGGLSDMSLTGSGGGSGPGRRGGSVDSTISRAHQHAAGARRDGHLQKEPPGGVHPEPDDHGLGRSRGGFTTKTHLACEQGRKTLAVVITAGQRGDSPQFITVLERIRVYRSVVAGHGPVPTWSWPTRRTPAAATAATPAAARSGCVSRARPTRTCTARPKGPKAAARPPSTRRSTGYVTPWNAASTSSSNIGPWPPDTTNSPSASKPPSPSPSSTNGFAPYETRPRHGGGYNSSGEANVLPIR